MIFPDPPVTQQLGRFGQRHRAAGLLERGRRVSTWPERPAVKVRWLGKKTNGKCYLVVHPHLVSRLYPGYNWAQ